MIFKHSTRHRMAYTVVFAIVVAGFAGCGAKPAQQAQSSTGSDTDATASGTATTLTNSIGRETRKPPKCGFDAESIKELRELSTEEVQSIVAGHRTTPRLKYLFAMCLYHGIHLPADSAAAATLLLEAGEAGYPDACLTLAVAFRDGKLYERDTVNQKIWLREAAQAGSSEAAYRLSEFYRNGRLNDRIAWLHVAAEMGHKNARRQLIQYLAESGDGVDVDSDVDKWAEESLKEEQTIEAHYVLGLLANAVESVDKAKRHFEYGATHSHIPSMFALAQLLLLDFEDKDNRDEAFALLEKAAKMNDGRAMLMLAEIKCLGLFNQTRSREAAEQWLQKAEALPNRSPRVDLSIGHFYKDLLKDRKSALRYYRSASQSGFTEAQIGLIEILADDPSSQNEAKNIAEALHRAGVESGTIALAKLLIKENSNSPKLRPEPPLYDISCSGSVPAQLTLARYYLGEIVGQNSRIGFEPFEATRWLMVILDTPNVEVDHPLEWYDAVSTLAECYEQGIGVPKDLAVCATLRSSIAGVTLRGLNSQPAQK